MLSGVAHPGRLGPTPVRRPQIGNHATARSNTNGSPVTCSTRRFTAALDAGVALRDVQEAASHADPRTTMRCDRARRSLDRHATYNVATFVAGAS
jgi:hypothetical protein